MIARSLLCLTCLAAACAAPREAPADDAPTTGAESAAQADAGADAGPSFVERERKRMARQAEERDRDQRREAFIERNWR